MQKIFLSFDFYGSGNIGDDLMLDGFLKGIKDYKMQLSCCLARDTTIQQDRFPGIKFYRKEDRERIMKESKIWIGAGDTPIQVKSGNWILNKLTRDIEQKRKNEAKYYFIGTGAEAEAVSEKENFEKILSEIDFIWTRDKFTSDFLIDVMNVAPERISTSSDLANISLKNIFTGESKESRKYDLGLCYYDEIFDKGNINSIRGLVTELLKKKKKCMLFGNQISGNNNFEETIYSDMFGIFQKTFRRNLKIYSPDYFGITSLHELVRHYSNCKTVMTSRYHALLAGAWAGCRLVSLERSSKVTALCKLLGIDEIKKPFTHEKLMDGFEKSKPVKREILEKLYEDAFKSIEQLGKKVLMN